MRLFADLFSFSSFFLLIITSFYCEHYNSCFEDHWLGRLSISFVFIYPAFSFGINGFGRVFCFYAFICGHKGFTGF